jgi:ATP-binding cassette subfamily A (ABC1) protein 1
MISPLFSVFQCLSSTVAFGFGCSYFAKYEEQGVGAQWSNVMSSPIPEDTFSLARCMILMLADSIMYLIVTWYVEAVFPGKRILPLFSPFYQDHTQ